MDKAEEKQVAEIKRMEEAIQKTSSPYLKKDYKKAIRRMRAELREYKAWKSKSGLTA